jgi:hypothetical protein
VFVCVHVCECVHALLHQSFINRDVDLNEHAAHFPGLIPLTHKYMTAHLPGLEQAQKCGRIKPVVNGWFGGLETS